MTRGRADCHVMTGEPITVSQALLCVLRASYRECKKLPRCAADAVKLIVGAGRGDSTEIGLNTQY